MFSKLLFIEKCAFPQDFCKSFSITDASNGKSKPEVVSEREAPPEKKQVKEDEKRMSSAIRIVLTAV